MLDKSRAKTTVSEKENMLNRMRLLISHVFLVLFNMFGRRFMRHEAPKISHTY